MNRQFTIWMEDDTFDYLTQKQRLLLASFCSENDIDFGLKRWHEMGWISSVLEKSPDLKPLDYVIVENTDFVSDNDIRLGTYDFCQIEQELKWLKRMNTIHREISIEDILTLIEDRENATKE